MLFDFGSGGERQGAAVVIAAAALTYRPPVPSEPCMTFDFTPEQQVSVTRAREAALRLGEAAAQAVDAQGAIPDAVRQAVKAAVGDPFAHGGACGVAVVEEVAAVVASVAVAMGLEEGAGADGQATVIPLALPGLRGAERAVAVAERASGAARDRARLVLSAAAVGVGRAAVAHAVDAMKARGTKPGGDEPTPYWSLADAAAEIDAARLLTAEAAQGLDRGDGAAVGLARRLAAGAAERAVEAALCVVGPSGYQRGSLLERLGRDARTLSLVLA